MWIVYSVTGVIGKGHSSKERGGKSSIISGVKK